MRITTLTIGQKTTRRTLATVIAATAVLSAAGPLAGTAAAANVVPGANNSGKVVVSDSTALQVTVHAADAAATAITGSVTNTSSDTFTCSGIGAADPNAGGPSAGDIAPADVVLKSQTYYKNNLYRELPSLPLNISGLPLIGNWKLGDLGLGSVASIFQEFGGLAGQANKARSEISEGYSQARVAGHAGQIPTFTLAPEETQEFSVALPQPTSGARTDFDAAAFIMCTKDDTKQPHLFVGYEEGTTAPTVQTHGTLGSAGSSGQGSPAGAGGSSGMNAFGSLGRL
ncbi:hypothetical protein GC425_05285 [Corynebacterium sp. zg254]|uniref:Secreted protein n=1 Tax=Corynebacterium zhongnanshanii TaxID=2768834 RepID=A0ABQ6VE17_9CORY|nr:MULTISPECIES: hypothetical protein [Corynebacterium]KAB3522672.1 hypothetical protein F8377_00325 [Corynebacterium zhongnanshanii]MCR5914280.1 hypothetical protein [Corynebacterium sp. zg254]